MKVARDIMTSEVISTKPDASVQEIARIFTKKNISGLPVLDAENTLVGIVTESDLIFQNKRPKVLPFITILDSFLFIDSPDKMDSELKKIAGSTVREICTSGVVTITPDTPLDEIATIMTEQNIHTLPVVDDQGRMVGIVGKKDIIRTVL